MPPYRTVAGAMRGRLPPALWSAFRDQGSETVKRGENGKPLPLPKLASDDGFRGRFRCQKAWTREAGDWRAAVVARRRAGRLKRHTCGSWKLGLHSNTKPNLKREGTEHVKVITLIFGDMVKEPIRSNSGEKEVGEKDESIHTPNVGDGVLEKERPNIVPTTPAIVPVVLEFFANLKFAKDDRDYFPHLITYLYRMTKVIIDLMEQSHQVVHNILGDLMLHQFQALHREQIKNSNHQNKHKMDMPPTRPKKASIKFAYGVDEDMEEEAEKEGNEEEEGNDTKIREDDDMAPYYDEFEDLFTFEQPSIGGPNIKESTNHPKTLPEIDRARQRERNCRTK
ncbi:hypothetical protein Gotur_028209 [Gossypium turneri]